MISRLVTTRVTTKTVPVSVEDIWDQLSSDTKRQKCFEVKADPSFDMLFLKWDGDGTVITYREQDMRPFDPEKILIYTKCRSLDELKRALKWAGVKA